MNTTVKNNAPHLKTIAWTQYEAPRPSMLTPHHRDVIRGDHGPQVVRHRITIKPGETGDMPASVLADLRETDPAVRAWFDEGALTVVEAA